MIEDSSNVSRVVTDVTFKYPPEIINEYACTPDWAGGGVRVCVGAGVGVGVGVGGREGRERDRKEGACVTPINDSSNLSPVVTGDMCKSRQRLSRSTPRGCTHLLLALII